MEAERKSADPTLTLSTALQRAMGPAKPARPFSSGTRGNLSGTPASSSAIVRLFLPLSPSLCLSVSLSLSFSPYDSPQRAAAHYPRLFFRALAADGVHDGRGQRPKEKEKNQSWTRTVGPQNLPVTSPSLRWDHSVCGNCRARARSPVLRAGIDRSIRVTCGDRLASRRPRRRPRARCITSACESTMT